jgi:hypothetical protein
VAGLVRRPRSADPRLRLGALAQVSGTYDVAHAELPATFSGQIAPPSATFYLPYLLLAWNRIYHLYQRPSQVFAHPMTAPSPSSTTGITPTRVLALLPTMIARSVLGPGAAADPGGAVVTDTSKITASHRERLCLVYVRQSTLAQTRANTESLERQHELAGRAVAPCLQRYRPARRELTSPHYPVSAASARATESRVASSCCGVALTEPGARSGYAPRTGYGRGLSVTRA